MHIMVDERIVKVPSDIQGTVVAPAKIDAGENTSITNEQGVERAVRNAKENLRNTAPGNFTGLTSRPEQCLNRMFRNVVADGRDLDHMRALESRVGKRQHAAKRIDERVALRERLLELCDVLVLA